MKMFNRREEPGTPPESPTAVPPPVTESLARVLALIQHMVVPPEVWLMPHLDDGAAAAEAVSNAGRADGMNNKADKLSREVTLAHQGTVVKNVLELSEVVGKRAYTIMAALKAGQLTEGFTPAHPLKGWAEWRAASIRTKALLLAAFLAEIFFGSLMAERLVGTSDYVSWVVGVAVATLMTMASLSIATAAAREWPGLIRGSGLRIGLVVAVVGVLFLAFWAIGLGGGAEATPSGGGLQGGTSVGAQEGDEGSAIAWMLVLVYAFLLMFLLTTVVLSHLLDKYEHEVERVDSDMRNKAKVLSREGQALLCIKLLRQCLLLKDQSKHRAQGLVMSYIGGARSVLSAEINSMWDTTAMEHLEIPDPAWVIAVEKEIQRLERDLDAHGNEPDPPLTLAGGR